MAHPIQNLPNEQLDFLSRHRVSNVSEVLGKVNVTKFLDEPNVSVSHNHIFQLNYVDMVQLLQHRDFSQRGRWNSVVKILNFSAFECDGLARVIVNCFENIAVGPLSDRMQIHSVLVVQIVHNLLSLAFHHLINIISI